MVIGKYDNNSGLNLLVKINKKLHVNNGQKVCWDVDRQREGE